MTEPPVPAPSIDDDRVDRYLDRLGLDTRPRADAESLRALQVAHLESIPFENLDIHADRPIVLDADVIVDKLTIRRRGGFCYELNGAFAALLNALGYRVTLMEARVIDNGAIGIPFDHLCLRVDLDRPWLVDVGFGESNREPLLLDTTDEQVDPAGSYRIVPTADDWHELLDDGTPTYRFSMQPRSLGDFSDGCLYHQTSPESHFTRQRICSRATPTGRITISDDRLIETVDGSKTGRELDGRQLATAFEEHFDIRLDDD